MLLRTSALRTALRASPPSPLARQTLPNSSILRATLTSSSRPNASRTLLSSNLALTAHKPAATALVRHFTQANALRIDLDKTKLGVDTKNVTVDSSVRPVMGHEVRATDDEPHPDMMKNIRSDMDTIRETFTLEEVPKQALTIGLAGVLPYLGTASATVFLANEINHAAVSPLNAGYLLSHDTAELLLHIVEPIQVGYGAVILSFLGAIHWGLEFAGYGGHFGYKRYMIGVWAPAIAWPTLLLPVESALIAQFVAFTFLYNTDARASAAGRAPHWYGIYRFVLTFIVGASLVATLIAHGHVAGFVTKTHDAGEKMQQLRSIQGKEQAEEEAVTRKNIAEKEEAEEEGGDDDEEEEKEEDKKDDKKEDKEDKE